MRKGPVMGRIQFTPTTHRNRCVTIAPMLKIVADNTAKKPKRKEEPHLLKCPNCGCSVGVPVVSGAEWSDKGYKNGRKSLICALCLARENRLVDLV